MKQNQTVTLPVLEAKKSTFSAWCEKENQLFSCVLESVVTNRQVCLMAHASLAFMALAGSAFKKLFQKVCGLKNNPHLWFAMNDEFSIMKTVEIGSDGNKEVKFHLFTQNYGDISEINHEQLIRLDAFLHDYVTKEVKHEK